MVGAEVESWCSRADAALHQSDDRLSTLLRAMVDPKRELGHASLHAMLDDLSDMLDVHLDAFSRDSTKLDDVAVRELCVDRRPVFEGVFLIRAAQLSRQRVCVRALYPGRVLVDLVGSALGRPRSSFEARLFGTARSQAPLPWRLLEATFELTAQRSEAWSRWPSPITALEVCAALDEAKDSWAAAIADERSRWRGTQHVVVRRDPAYHRARRWWQLSRQLFARLTHPRGELRFVLEHGLAALDRCASSRSQATCELVVLEVFAMADETLARDQGAQPPRLEVGQAARRKRLQRARLDALAHWTPASRDARWPSFLDGLDLLADQFARDEPEPPERQRGAENE